MFEALAATPQLRLLSTYCVILWQRIFMIMRNCKLTKGPSTHSTYTIREAQPMN